MTSLRSEKRIEAFKHQIINSTLMFASILGIISFIIVPVPLKASSFTFDFVSDSLSVLLVIVLFIVRNRISILVKSIGTFILLFNLFITDLLTFGLYSFDKVFIIAIPFYALLVFDIRRTLMLFVLIVAIYLLIGYFFITGKMEIRNDVLDRAVDMNLWIESILLISVVVAIVVVYSYNYNKNLSNLITELEVQNKTLVQHQDALAESERKYREIFNTTSDAIFLQDPEKGTILDVNDTMLKMYGYKSINEVLSLDIESVSAVEKGYNTKKALKKISNANYESPITFDWIAKKKNGDHFLVEVSLRKTSIGGQERILAVVRDRSEQEQARKNIAESKERYRKLVESFPDIVMISDLEGNIVFGNEQLEKVPGITPDDYSNKNRKAHIHPDDLHLVVNAMKDLLNSDKVHSDTIENRFIDS